MSTWKLSLLLASGTFGVALGLAALRGLTWLLVRDENPHDVGLELIYDALNDDLVTNVDYASNALAEGARNPRYAAAS